MAIAFDVATVATAYNVIGTQTTSHAASASARAAVVLIHQSIVDTSQVSGVTYGGAAMALVGDGPYSEATEPGMVFVYWLDNVAIGTQNVAMTTTGTNGKQLVVATMTAASGATIAVAGDGIRLSPASGWGSSVSVADPSWTITGLTASTALEAFEVIHSGLTTMTSTPATSWTLISSTDLGSQGRGFARQSVASSGTTLTCGWTAAIADDFVGCSVAFKEVAGGSATFQASGTALVVSTAIGDVTRVPLTLAASGTSRVAAAINGDVTRVPLTLTTSGTIPAMTVVTGNAIVVGAAQTLAASGTVATVAATSGNAARVPLTLTASGTVLAVAASSGNPTRVGLALAAAGTIPAAAATSGDATRTPLTLAAGGTIVATTAINGDPARATLTLSVSGTIAITATTAGDVTRTLLVSAVSGTVTITVITDGSPIRQTLILDASGTVVAAAVVTGAVIGLGPPVDITVTGSLDARRWSAVMSVRDKVGTLEPRRWKGTL